MPYKNSEKEKEYQRKWHQDHKEERIKRAAISNSEVKVRNKEYVRSYLSTHPCIDCGESDIVVLEFDHVTGEKRDEISAMVNKCCSIKTIQEEINKCEVRCANCHRRVTYYRRLSHSRKVSTPS